VFTVDCHRHNVDILFTENETNSLRRCHVLQKRQLKNKKPCDSNTGNAEMRSTDEPVSDSCLTQPTDSCLPATAHAECATSTCSSAELSELLRANEVACDSYTDSSDTDSCSDEDTGSSSHLQSSVVTAHYTKDAFHKYIIAGSYMLSYLFT